jgi:hypothetical protein
MQHALHPFSEPWRSTAWRTGSLALMVGVVAGLRSRQLVIVPLATALALWFTLGGHFLELFFRNRLRQHFGARAPIQILARVLFWFLGGALLFAGAMATRALLTGRTAVPVSWWLAGIAFVGAELLVHLGLHLLGRANLYDGQG